MSALVKKLEAVKFGKVDIAVVDIIAITQKDGTYQYSLGAVNARNDKEGSKVAWHYTTFVRVLEINNVSSLDCERFNEYTKSYKTKEDAARMVYKFASRFNVKIGKDAAAIGNKEKEKTIKTTMPKTALQKCLEILNRDKKTKDSDTAKLEVVKALARSLGYELTAIK